MAAIAGFGAFSVGAGPISNDIIGYTVYVYSTTSGRILGPSEVPISEPPTWQRQINANGSWQVRIKLGATNWTQQQLRSICTPGRFSVGIFWGDYGCQGGPITSYAVDDVSGVLTLSGGGLWSILNRRPVHSTTFNPDTTAITDLTADVSFTGQLWDIAGDLLRTATGWLGRPGSALPLDIPVDSGTGTAERNYTASELASTGQRLQELTQVDGGPDIDFAPYRVVGDNMIRHRAMIGQPFIQQQGEPVMFDYGSSLQSLSIDGDGSNVSTTVWTKGAGNERLQLLGRASSTVLTDAGFPAMDMVDTRHTDATEQATLNGWATAGLGLYGRSVEAWKAIARVDASSPLGSYDPGFFGKYNLNGHPWMPDGIYTVRILGIGSSQEPNTIMHLLDGRGGF